MKKYLSRPIRFLELIEYNEWTIKAYSISENSEFIDQKYFSEVKKQLEKYLNKAELTGMQTYSMATLIIHEYSNGCFAIVNWWIDDNMLQHNVYHTPRGAMSFEKYHSNEIVTCVWEMSVFWFERNAWLKHILSDNEPNFKAYLNEQLNQD